MKPCSTAQRDFIDNLSVDLNLSTRAAKFGYCATTLDREINGWDDLSSSDASMIITRMKEQKDRIKSNREWLDHQEEFGD